MQSSEKASATATEGSDVSGAVAASAPVTGSSAELNPDGAQADVAGAPRVQGSASQGTPSETELVPTAASPGAKLDAAVVSALEDVDGAALKGFMPVRSAFISNFPNQ